MKTVQAYWKGITNYTKYHLSNGIIEGIISKVQLAKARARGYRNTTNFINMIYFIAGKLTFKYPLYCKPPVNHILCRSMGCGWFAA